MKAQGKLIKSGHTFVFRQYSRDGEYKDYAILHDSLTISIEDDTAVIDEDIIDSTVDPIMERKI